MERYLSFSRDFAIVICTLLQLFLCTAPAQDSRANVREGTTKLTFTEGNGAPFEVRIHFSASDSWPGDNSQVIEVYKDSKKVSSKQVGGEPVAIEAWGAVDHHTGPSPSGIAYIYILCEHRRRESKAIYVYRITEKLSIKYCGVVFTKEELRKEGNQAVSTEKTSQAFSVGESGEAGDLTD